MSNEKCGPQFPFDGINGRRLIGTLLHYMQAAQAGTKVPKLTNDDLDDLYMLIHWLNSHVPPDNPAKV